MLSIMLLAADVSHSLVRFLIWVVIIGGIVYIVRLLPIDAVFKQIALVVGVLIIFILAIQILLPLAGV